MASNKLLEAKKRFGLLLYHFIDAGFSYEHIERVVIHDPFFLFFEQNRLDDFLSVPIEDIIENIFHKKVYIDYSKQVAAEIFWAGEMYITLLLNERIPLQRSMIICPILKMISFFNPYHEMNDYHLCKRYLEEEKKASVLKFLMGGKTSIRKLSFLTAINQRSLTNYLCNDRLFSASFEMLI